MIEFQPDTLYQWLSDFEGFSYAFKRYCFHISQAFNVSTEFDSKTLRFAHEKWAAECESWRTQHFPHQTDALSHAKVVALLLHNLAPVPYIARMREHEFESDLHYQFAGTPDHPMPASNPASILNQNKPPKGIPLPIQSSRNRL